MSHTLHIHIIHTLSYIFEAREVFCACRKGRWQVAGSGVALVSWGAGQVLITRAITIRMVMLPTAGYMLIGLLLPAH